MKIDVLPSVNKGKDVNNKMTRKPQTPRNPPFTDVKPPIFLINKKAPKRQKIILQTKHNHNNET
ncbi:hypothetical protein, partial [Kingella kingae]|uniref:hypothetical protein n=1 Tax=Kingella kingae TaxID=504 RepID=UPI001EE1E15A